MSLGSSSTDCLTEAQGRHAQFQDMPRTLHHRSLLDGVNFHDPGSLAPSFGAHLLRKGLQTLLSLGGKQRQKHLSPMLDPACLRILCGGVQGINALQVHSDTVHD